MGASSDPHIRAYVPPPPRGAAVGRLGGALQPHVPESLAPVHGDVFPASAHCGGPRTEREETPAAEEPGISWEQLRQLNRECFDRAQAAEARKSMRQKAERQADRKTPLLEAASRRLGCKARRTAPAATAETDFFNLSAETFNEDLFNAAERDNANEVRALMLRGRALTEPSSGVAGALRAKVSEALATGGVGADGWTGLMRAALFGFDRVLRALLDSGVDMRRQNLFGQTALELAVQQGHSAAVELLLATPEGRACARLHDSAAVRLALESEPMARRLGLGPVRELAVEESARARALASSLEAAEETAEDLARTAEAAAEAGAAELSVALDAADGLRAALRTAEEEKASLRADLERSRSLSARLRDQLEEAQRESGSISRQLADDYAFVKRKAAALSESLERCEEEKQAAKRDGEQMVHLLESMEKKLLHATETLKAADISSQLCVQSTTLATRVAAALEQRAQSLDERAATRDEFWSWRAQTITARNAALDTEVDELRKRECGLIRKNAQLLQINSELEKENGDLRGRLEGYESELVKRDVIEIKQYSIADPEEVDFPSPSSFLADPVDPVQPRLKRVRFADEKPSADGSDPAAEREAYAVGDRFYEWLMIDECLDGKGR